MNSKLMMSSIRGWCSSRRCSSSWSSFPRYYTTTTRPTNSTPSPPTYPPSSPPRGGGGGGGSSRGSNPAVLPPTTTAVRKVAPQRWIIGASRDTPRLALRLGRSNALRTGKSRLAPSCELDLFIVRPWRGGGPTAEDKTNEVGAGNTLNATYRLTPEAVAKLIVGLQQRQFQLQKSFMFQTGQKVVDTVEIQPQANNSDNVKIIISRQATQAEKTSVNAEEAVLTSAEAAALQSQLHSLLPYLAQWNLALANV